MELMLMMVPLRRVRMAGRTSWISRAIHLKLSAGFLERHVLDCTIGTVPCIVHQDIDTAGLGQDLFDTQSRGFVVGDIHRKRFDPTVA
jgi:hypothetical protein